MLPLLFLAAVSAPQFLKVGKNPNALTEDGETKFRFVGCNIYWCV